MRPILALLMSGLLLGCNAEDSPTSQDTSANGAAGDATAAGTSDAAELTLHSDPRAFFEGLGGKVSPYNAPADEVMWLKLTVTNVTDNDLVNVKSFPNLKSIELVHTQISDKGLVHLQGLQKLEKLYLIKTSVTDDGLVHLKDLPALTILGLDETQVSDAGIAHLKQFKSLPNLDVSLGGTRVTQAGLRELKQAQAAAGPAE